MFSNITVGFILLDFNCDSEVPALGTGYTNNLIKQPKFQLGNISASGDNVLIEQKDILTSAN